MKKTLLILLVALPQAELPSWGFFAHKKINRLAVFTLPPPMIGFYKANLAFIEETAVNPDRRRYAVEAEGPRHFLDADHYGDSVFAMLPPRWDTAVRTFGEDTLKKHGVLPWHLYTVYRRLQDAFLVKDPARILRLSAELGHYVSDAHVPLHTTRNYNGQLTGQEGIHGLWESRLPELFSEKFELFVGKATYLNNPRQTIWQIVESAHALVPEVLRTEKLLAERFGEKRFSFEARGSATIKVHSQEYARVYHRMLGGMVEKQMRASVKATGDLWYTAWVDAGQPNLTELISHQPSEEEIRRRLEELESWKIRRSLPRIHE